jgi:hypothetical protein
MGSFRVAKLWRLQMLTLRHTIEINDSNAEAVIDERGTVRLLEPVEIAGVRRALVTILDEEPTSLTHETPIVSERSLAEDWNRPEEDAAWLHLQRDR